MRKFVSLLAVSMWSWNNFSFPEKDPENTQIYDQTHVFLVKLVLDKTCAVRNFVISAAASYFYVINSVLCVWKSGKHGLFVF